MKATPSECFKSIEENIQKMIKESKIFKPTIGVSNVPINKKTYSRIPC